MKLLNAGFCVLFLAFATLRAARVPLTYDEAASYIRYIDSSVPSVFDPDVLSLFDFEVATNHFLNTLATKASVLVGGNSEFVLRVPNLIGYAMFMTFSLLILQRSVRPVLATAGFLLLNLNPYVLDFFALSRGYGLSLGFLMGAIFYIFSFLADLEGHQEATRQARRALGFALGAVLSNFALLNVWLSVFGVLVAGFMFRNTVFGVSQIQDSRSRIPAWSSKVWVVVSAAVFAAVVFSQDSRLSTSLYEPLTVRITGLDAAQDDRVAVVRIDLRGRESRLPHVAGATDWRWPGRVPYRGLRIDLPADAADQIEHIEVTIGNRLFSFDPRRGGGWRRHDTDSTRAFEVDASLISLAQSRFRRFQPVMNWAGDTRYAASLAAATAGALAILVAFALLLSAAGWAAARVNALTATEWRPLELAALSAAAFVGPPLYLLNRDSELYFGGTRGLVVDTFYSTIDGSFYGRTYHPAQTSIVFVGALIGVAVFCLALDRHRRRHTLATMLHAATILTILIVTSLSLVVQHALFHTVYLVGRTALFYIPLYVLFATLLCEAIAALGRAGQIFATVLLAGTLLVATYHFTSTANMKYALDWRDDASTRMMIEDLEEVLAAEEPGRSQVVLGVDPAYWPVATYYAHRSPDMRVKIISLPAPSASDFQYVEDRGAPAMNIVRRYSLTHTVLVRTGARR